MESNKNYQQPSHPEQNPADIWEHIKSRLSRVVKKWVYSAKVATWRGQREDIVDDIVQEAMTRAWNRYCQGERGELPPVESIEKLCVKIARNCFIDMIRHDQRLLPIVEGAEDRAQDMSGETESLADLAEEHVFSGQLFDVVVAEVINFSPKLRAAFLIEVACGIPFEEEQTPLQKAFWHEGVALEAYRHKVPKEGRAHSRHASLVSLAYRRIRELASVQAYLASQ